MARLQQYTDHHKCCVRAKRRTSMNQMTRDGADGRRKRAESRLPSTMVIGRLNTTRRGQPS